MICLKPLSAVPGGHDGVSFVRGDVLALPFAAGVFDVALDRGCFHYLSPARWPDYAAEAQRVLRPGGRMLLRACLTSQLSAPVDRDGVRGHEIDAPGLQADPVGDGPGHAAPAGAAA